MQSGGCEGALLTLKHSCVLWDLSWDGFLASLAPWLLFEHGLGFPSLRVFVPGRAWKHHLLLQHSSASTHGAFNSSGRSPEIPVPVGDLPRARRNGAGRALSPAPNRFKRMGWTIPFQQALAAKCEVPGAEPSHVTLAGQGRATWREAAFLWILPKSPSSFLTGYSLGIWHPPHRIFSEIQQPCSSIIVPWRFSRGLASPQHHSPRLLSWNPSSLQQHSPQNILQGFLLPIQLLLLLLSPLPDNNRWWLRMGWPLLAAV